jgi:hypothetical protein
VPDVTPQAAPPTPVRGGPPCRTGLAVKAIIAARPDLAEAVTAAVSDPNVNALRAAEFLSKHSGQLVKVAALRYHRRRGTVNGCTCPKEGA